MQSKWILSGIIHYQTLQHSNSLKIVYEYAAVQKYVPTL